MYSIAPCVCMFLTNGRSNKNVTCAIQYFHEVQYTVQYLPPVCAIQYIHEVQYSAVFASSMCYTVYSKFMKYSTVQYICLQYVHFYVTVYTYCA